MREREKKKVPLVLSDQSGVYLDFTMLSDVTHLIRAQRQNHGMHAEQMLNKSYGIHKTQPTSSLLEGSSFIAERVSVLK